MLITITSKGWEWITFELSGSRWQDARPGLVKLYRVPPAQASWPAVGALLERGVRPHLRCFASAFAHLNAAVAKAAISGGKMAMKRN